MFRKGQCSEPNNHHFGVGSTIEKVILVVRIGRDSKTISLLDTRTMTTLPEAEMTVTDTNHLSLDEVRKLCYVVEPQWTFSDFNLDPTKAMVIK